MSKHKYHILAVKTIVSLVLTVASMLKSSFVDNKELCKSSDEAIASSVKGLYPQLEIWIKANLHGTSFGCSQNKFCEHESKEELKVNHNFISQPLSITVTLILVFPVNSFFCQLHSFFPFFGIHVTLDLCLLPLPCISCNHCPFLFISFLVLSLPHSTLYSLSFLPISL